MSTPAADRAGAERVARIPQPARHTARNGSVEGPISPSSVEGDPPQREERAGAREATSEGPVAEGRYRCWAAVAELARLTARKLLAAGRDLKPPELWEHPRPSLRDVWRYAAYGTWTGEGTVGRKVGKAYAVLVVIPAHTVGYFGLWVLERPARLIASALLCAFIGVTPAGSIAVGSVLSVLRWLVT
jgi:hypothetical protein